MLVALSYLFDPEGHLLLHLLEGSLSCLVLLYKFISGFSQFRQQLLHPTLQLQKTEKYVTCQTTQEPGDTPELTGCAGWHQRQDYSDIGMEGGVRDRACYSVLRTFAEVNDRNTLRETSVVEISESVVGKEDSFSVSLNIYPP